jgi:tetratricopeptide (TPR) repeat protein
LGYTVLFPEAVFQPMKLIKSLAVLTVLLAAQIALRQHSSFHQISIRLADIDRELLQNPPERNQLLLEKARLLESTGHFEHALRAYRAVPSVRPEQIAALTAKLESQRQELAGSRRTPRLFAVLVGISEYEAASLPRVLTGEADASAFGAFLKNGRQIGGNPQVFALIGRNAREAAVRAALQTVLKTQAGPDDTVIVYISAHGLTEPAPNRRAFLMAVDTNPWEKTAAGYAFSTVRALLDNHQSRPRNVVLIADLCRAKAFQGRPNDINKVLEQQLGASNPYIDVILAGCADPPGAGAPGSLGLFTHFVVQGLNRAADRNGDLRVTTAELFTYVRAQTGIATRWQAPAVRFGAQREIPLVQVAAARVAQPVFALLAGVSPFLAYAQASSGEAAVAQLGFTEADPAFRLAVASEDLGQQVILKYLEGEDTPQSQADFDRGAEFFQQANELNPTPLLAAREAFCLGRSMIFQRRFAEAVKQLEATLTVEPDAAYAYNAIGIAYLEQAQFARAADNFRQAIGFAPSWPYPRNNLALTLAEIGMYRNAETEYRAAIERAPRSAYLRYNLAVLLHRRNRLREARSVYDELIAQQPGLAHAHTAKGALLASTGDYDKAAEQYEIALSIDPSSAAARHNLGIAYARRQQFNKAAELWEANTKANPDFAPSRICLAETYERLEQWPKAAQQYEAMLKRDVGLVAARVAMAEALRRAGSLKEAEAALRTAANDAPAYWLVRERLGDLLHEMGSSEASAQYQLASENAYERADKRRLNRKLRGVHAPYQSNSNEKTSCFP